VLQGGSQRHAARTYHAGEIGTGQGHGSHGGRIRISYRLYDRRGTILVVCAGGCDAAPAKLAQLPGPLHLAARAINQTDFYFRALGSLVVLSFSQLVSFFSVFLKPLSETLRRSSDGRIPV
jgi:hypothetical protein